MNQVMVEEMSQGWMEPDSRITETYAEQPITMQEDDEYMSYLSHYVVQGDQHIPVYQTTTVNAKARDMNNKAPDHQSNATSAMDHTRQMSVHKRHKQDNLSNVMDARGLIIIKSVHTGITMHCQWHLQLLPMFHYVVVVG